MNSWAPNRSEWMDSYQRDGYLVVENAVDSETLGQMRSELDRIEDLFDTNQLPPHLQRFVATDEKRSKTFGVGEGSTKISNIMELPVFAPVFADLIVNPRILDILETIFDSSEFSFHNYKAICKMPHNNTPFQWHRDLPYLQHTTPNLITCMICVDDMTKENGATVVCPGSHRIAHEDVTVEDRNIPEAKVPAPRVTVECPAGSAVLFHVNIVHGGGPNLSETKRRNAISIWSGPNCLPVTSARFAYEFVKPRSKDPMCQKQVALTFGSRAAS